MFTNYTYVYATTGTNTSGVILQEKLLALFKLYAELKQYRENFSILCKIQIDPENGNRIFPLSHHVYFYKHTR